MSLSSDRRRRAKIDESVTKGFTPPILRVMRREEKRVLAATTPQQAVNAVREAEWVAVITSLWLSEPIMQLWDDQQKALGTSLSMTKEARRNLTDAATANGKAIAAARRRRIDRIVFPEKSIESAFTEKKLDPFRANRTFRSTRRGALRAAYANVVDQAGATAHTQALSATETVRFESAQATSDTATFRLVKVWFTSGDNLVRSSHAAVNGQSRIMKTSKGKRVRSTFRVGGSNLAHPREPGGEPGEVINCRCFLEFRRVRRRGQQPPGQQATSGPRAAPSGSTPTTAPRSTATPDLRDARHTLDELSDQSVALHRKVDAEPGGWGAQPDRVNVGSTDPGLKVLRTEQGFDDLPKVVSPEDLADLVDDGWTPVYRGQRGGGTAHADAFMTGDHYPGVGMYGNGTYGSAAEDIAQHYAAGDTGSVMRMAINPDARVIKYDDLILELDDAFGAVSRPRVFDFTTEEAWNEAMFKFDLLYMDPGRYATAAGYDVIIEEGASMATEYVILNRGAVSVSSDISVIGGL